MSEARAWGFTDDRGAELGAARVPERVVAYIRAGAALLDLGVTPVAVYGSGHDGPVSDPAKAGGLDAAGVPYLGPGRVLDETLLRELRPDVIVDVTYDGKSPYALDEAVAERLGVPLVALSVGNELTLPAILDRFGELSASLRAGTAMTADRADLTDLGDRVDRTDLADLGEAEAVLRGVAGRTGLAVLALSGAGPDQVHLARPQAWPELARLAELGVRLLDPGPGPGANWLTADWGRVAELRPDLILFDNRFHAVPPYETPPGTRLTPWNPEAPPSPAAYARFFRDLAESLAA
ncbi:ABC transporter substrate-binding protein [Streptomyces sp. NBC_00094]|uniref:ABC transporter substrate-binding protein n=1 Tax=Streptomyces sp. NBC_00094 TaxID=2903620 RepID=UPI00224F380D|nr:ABC transporter substrate-binding protein [Streptomyces sp. NBC_00094]MCX5391392.1 ABC transporter substrate-binding protein [Streptomyces sp. NBC_00094]